MRGAQYLHEPIPLATSGPEFQVKYELRGTAEQYRNKIYSHSFRGTVSPEDLPENHKGWDIRTTYDRLWDLYGPQVIPDDLSLSGQAQKVYDWAKPDICISTVPANLLCIEEDHHFRCEYVWSNDMAVDGIEDNTVICNGLESPAWYRTAKIQGHTTTEWPHILKPPFAEIHNVVKPLNTNCTCFPQILRMGRYGKWQKGVLSHSAFYETVELLNEPQQMGFNI